jgi:hypothetical protein
MKLISNIGKTLSASQKIGMTDIMKVYGKNNAQKFELCLVENVMNFSSVCYSQVSFRLVQSFNSVFRR